MWGHGHDQRQGEQAPLLVTPQQADSILREDLGERLHVQAHVAALAPWANQNQFDALCSFAYNLGLIPLATMLHHGQAAVPQQIVAWHYMHVKGVLVDSSGLAARRKDELAQYES